MPNGSLQVLLIDCGSRKFGDLARMVAACGHSGQRMALADAAVQQLWPWEAILISGGPHLFTDPGQAPWLRHSFSFLQQPLPPLFGICLGFQAIALAAGGSIFRGPACRSPGLVRLTHPHALTAGLAAETLFGEDHCEGVQLPPAMVCLGASLHYPVEISVDPAQRRCGVQFHPEISGEPGALLLRNFFALARSAVW